jgi:hypothetical protein
MSYNVLTVVLRSPKETPRAPHDGRLHSIRSGVHRLRPVASVFLAGVFVGKS